MKKTLLVLLSVGLSFAAKADLNTCCYYAKKKLFGQSTCGKIETMENKFKTQNQSGAFVDAFVTTTYSGEGQVVLELVNEFYDKKSSRPGVYELQSGGCYAYETNRDGIILSSDQPLPSPVPAPAPVPYPSDYVTCKSRSNGYTFSSRKLTRRNALEIAISKCQDHSYTTNYECREFVDCTKGDKYSPEYVCKTISNEHQFRERSANLSVARNYAISRCIDHSYTRNNSCESFVQCKRIDETPYIKTCYTESNGYRFSYSGWELRATSGYVIQKCKNHSYTVNHECGRFVECR